MAETREKLAQFLDTLGGKVGGSGPVKGFVKMPVLRKIFDNLLTIVEADAKFETKANIPQEYAAVLSQTGVAAPVEDTVVKNSLSDDIVWARSNVGVYTGTLVGAFPVAKTIVILSNVGSLGVDTAKATRLDDDTIQIETFAEGASVGVSAAADDILSSTGVLIKVYP